MTIDDRWQDLQEAIANAESVKSQPIGQSTQLRTPAESPERFMHCRACSAAINAGAINIKEGVALCEACGELGRLADLQSVHPSKQISNARCPDCAQELNAESINIGEGVALCPACGRLSRLSEAIHGGPSSQELMTSPPENCSIVPTNRGIEVQISSRSMPKFIGLTLFAMFWNGAICTFAMPSAIEFYERNIGPVPAWIVEFAPNMDMEITDTPLFDLLLLAPFSLIGAFVVLGALDALLGKQSVVVEENTGYYLAGFKWLNWKKRFDPHQVRSIEVIDTQWKTEQLNNKQILLEANRTIKFGAFLDDEKIRWMVATLRELLLPKTNARQTSMMERISAILNRGEIV